jgi:thiol-disulfide isomerase/thioredoxin
MPAEVPSRLAGELDARGLAQAIAHEKGRVVLLNFWATWCVPCREEFPQLSRLQLRHRAAGLSVLGVSTDFAKAKPAVEEFLREQKPSFPNYRKKSGGDDQKFIEAVDSSWGGELPFSVLYDRSGRKVKVFSGELPFAAAEKEIRSLLSGPEPAGR